MNRDSWAWLGELLRGAFSGTAALPDGFRDLLARLEADAAGGAGPLPDAEFKATLTRLVPDLRAFARALARDNDVADDLVQDTMMKAWRARARFQAGTNMRAWCCTILRTVFISDRRRARFVGDWDDHVADRVLATKSTQEGQVDLADLQRALDQLPPPQREAVMLVGGGGFAYEEVAAITNVPIGTVKSRVARGRAALENMLAEGRLPSRRRDDLDRHASPLDAMMAEIDAMAGAA